jgi:hypothetical protein
MRQAELASDWLDRMAHAIARSVLIDTVLDARAAKREGLIYTRQGVLDMTRRHKLEEVVMDRFGQRTGENQR